MASNLIDGGTDIQAETILDGAISPSAAIAMSKIAGYSQLLLNSGAVAMAANLNLAGFLINNVASGVSSSDAVNLGQVTTLIAAAISGWTWAGAWSSGTAYAVNQFVTFSNAVYLCVTANTGNEPDTDGGALGVKVLHERLASEPVSRWGVQAMLNA